jgi:hypothetical protein
MNVAAIRAAGLAFSLLYAAFIGWLFAAQPRTIAEVGGALTSTVGVYRIDPEAFAQGLRYFHNDQFVEARAAFARADPATRDARTQFYVAYSFYRQGWHRTYHDDVLYRAGLDAIDKAIALSGGQLTVDDTALAMHTPDEVKAELQAGVTRDLSDFNPLRLTEPRK